MKNKIKYTLVITAVVLLVACGKKDAAVSESQAPLIPTIPTLNPSQILDLSKNEREELERRCLGISHQTCTELKSDSYKMLRDMKISRCETKVAFKDLENSLDREGLAREKQKCRDMF